MGEPHEPIALLTDFGWVVTGPIPEMIKYNADVASRGDNREMKLELVQAAVHPGAGTGSWGCPPFAL